MKNHILISALLIVFTTGCIGTMPKNAKEQRDFVRKGGFGSSFDSYTVNRSYSKVIKTIKAKSKNCLNKKVETRSCGGGLGYGCKTRFTTYNPTFIRSKKKSELHVQVVESHSVDLAGKGHKNGTYVTVVDIIRAGKKKTKLNVYTMAGSRYHSIPRAVKHWANRTNLGCPDFTQSKMF